MSKEGNWQQVEKGNSQLRNETQSGSKIRDSCSLWIRQNIKINNKCENCRIKFKNRKKYRIYKVEDCRMQFSNDRLHPSQNIDIEADLNDSASQIKKPQKRSSKVIHVRMKQSGQTVKEIQQTARVLQCRICLQTSEESDRVFVNPCECTGSVEYVHEDCFTSWVGTMLKTKRNGSIAKAVKEGISCQMCKMKFSIRLFSEKICTDWGTLKQKVKFRPVEFILFWILLSISIALLVVSAVFLPEEPFHFSDTSTRSSTTTTTSNAQTVQKIVLLSSIGALIFIIALLFYWMISEFGFTYQIDFAFKGKSTNAKTMKGILMVKRLEAEEE